ncbi:MAG: hypothetical protein PHY99_09135, partial [Bacteroidales bacterium]|nr:hypothetical protein [Bacteroidales bacterium]
MIQIRRLSGRSVRTGVLLLLLTTFFIPLRAMQGDTLLQPVRNLRIAIHVFQDDSGVGNFCMDSAGHQDFLDQLIGWVNNRLSNLDTLKPAVSSVFVGDSRVRIRLDTLFYHHDTKAWDCSSEIDSPYMRDRYVDGDSTLSYLQKYQTLPVFIGANNVVTGGHTRNLADRGYIAVRGYYESFIRQPLALSLDECGRNLVHELCHCLGLSHNFTGGADGEQCDLCEDNGCPMQGTSNNIMDYWPSYGYALSKCQFDEIHFCLNGGRGNISEIVINDSCYRVSRSVFRVSDGDRLVVIDTTYFHNDIRVENGGSLRVTGYLSMPGETNITVDAGGSLEIDGGTIGNLCGDLWAGIRLNKEDSVTPAKIMIVNGGMVEHARVGLLASGPINVQLNNAGFRNCAESAAFLKGSADTVLVNDCMFAVTDKLNHYEEGITPGVFLRADSIRRLVVTGSRFINEPGTYIFDADWLGTGIEASCPSVKVDHCEFINLTNGISLTWGNQESKFDVSENRFANNRYGVKSGYAGVQCITENSIILQRLNSGSSIGVLLNNPDKYVITGNHFRS